MRVEHLEGLIAAPFTPMLEDGSIRLDAVPAYYQMLKANGVKGAFINGTTGEGASLSVDEKRAMVAAWADCAKADPTFKVITLVGGTSLKECADMAVYAQEKGLYAIAFLAPYFYKPADVRMLAGACIEVARHAPGMPFYYYHIPSFTGCYFPMIDLLTELDGRLDNLAGIKYTHEDFMDYLACMRFKDGAYDILAGRDECLLASLALGARGAVGSTYNYSAPLYYRMIAAYNAGDQEQARALQLRSIDMIRLLGKYGGIAAGKAFMKFIGLDCGGFRSPVRNMDADAFAQFSRDAAALDFGTDWSKII